MLNTEFTSLVFGLLYKFINKLWDFVDKNNRYNIDYDKDQDLVIKLKQLINDVTQNIENFQFNKSVAKIYEYVNLVNLSISNKTISKANLEWSLKKLSLILQPFLPHISEEIWSKFKNSEMCIDQKWPVEKIESLIAKINIAIQINGKTRGVIEMENNTNKENALILAKNDKKIKKYLENKEILKEIYVPNKIINFVL